MNSIVRLLIAILLIGFGGKVLALENGRLVKAFQAVCLSPKAMPSALSQEIGHRVFIHETQLSAGFSRRQVSYLDEGDREVSIYLTFMEGQLRRANMLVQKKYGNTLYPVVATRTATAECRVLNWRLIERAEDGTAQWLVHLDANFAETGRREPLNPAVPDGRDPGGVTVAHIDSGVNYTLPAIAKRLARTPEGKLVGYDFWDMDELPYDVDASRSPFYPVHHGTLVASILVREAPELRLVPYRYPRSDMSRMAQVLEHAASNGAKIVAMPLGSNTESQWNAFKQAAADHAEMLFVVSAGNNGRNIDEKPVYPAAYDLKNVLVVTSSTISGRLAQGSNWGPQSVDLMVPAERVEVTDHRGASGRASGSSYAVPRVAALAARLLAQNPKWAAADLKAAIKNLTGPSFERSGPKVRWGWIPNPADDG